MCDYSLEHLTSRAAKVGDKLVTTHFKHSLTGGFCAIGEPNIAVCLKPGTEIAFLRLNQEYKAAHHDALELPTGQIVLVTHLCQGQSATVIQLPVEQSDAAEHIITELTPTSFAPR